MSRLQTKCVFASMTAHLLLLAVLVVSSAFVKPPPPAENIRKVKVFDASKITDDETQGGGNPNVPSDVQPAPPPPAAVIPQPIEPTPQVQQPPQEPPTRLIETPKAPPEKKKKPEKKPTPKVADTKPAEQPKPTDNKVHRDETSKRVVPKNKLTEKPVDPKPIEASKPKKPDIAIDLTTHTYKEDPEAQRRKLERERERERAAKEAREREAREEAARQAEIRAQNELRAAAERDYKERQQALSGVVGAIQNKMSSGTVVEMPGPGGEAFINYADVIYTQYYQAWQTPDGRDTRTPVKVEIVVARDGRVISSNIIKSSGDAQLDKSVRHALERVTKLPAFPAGAKDAERTFRISFELKSKRQFG